MIIMYIFKNGGGIPKQFFIFMLLDQGYIGDKRNILSLGTMHFDNFGAFDAP